MHPSIHDDVRVVLSSGLSRHGTCVWLLCLGLSLLPLSARGDVSPDVHRCAVAIHQLIGNLEYEQALEQVVHGKAMSKKPEDQVVMSLYEGVIMVELSGRLSDAEATFKAALFLNPAAKLPLLVSPKLKRHFESVRQDVLSELATRGVDREPLKMEAPTEAQRVQTPREPLPAVASGLPASSSSPVPEVSGSYSTLRDRALIPAVAGGALVVTAGVFWGLAEGKKSKLTHKAQHIGSQAEARNVASSARGLQTVSVGLLVGGLVGLGAATGMYLLGAPEEQGSLQVGLDGTSAFVSGRWP